MPAIGRLRDRVTFQVEANVADGGGGSELSWTDVVTVWGQFMPERGREQVDGGRLEASLRGVLRVRASSDTEAITTEHRVQIDSVPYNIRSISNPDRRDRFLEMVIEQGGSRGVAT